MNISAQFGDSQVIIKNVIERFDPNKTCLFWNGISASNSAKQKQYEQKIAKTKALKSSKPDKWKQDLEKIILQHEHKQRGRHYVATLEAVKRLQRELQNYQYELTQFVFCETSYLHRHNRLVVEELQGLDIETAGEEAIKHFGKPWEEEAHAAMRVLFEHADNYSIDYWKDWLATEQAAKYIHKTKEEYNNNQDFKKIVNQAASDKIGSKNVDAAILENSIAYILEEAAKVWGLQEEFSDYNLIVAYPGNLPPAVHYLMDHHDCNFIYLRIEFSGRLTVKKPGKLAEPVVPETQATNTNNVTNAIVPSGSHTQYSPIQQLLCTINNLPISDYFKDQLRRCAVKAMLEKPSSPKELWELGKLFFEYNEDTVVEPINTTLLRQALVATLSEPVQPIVSRQNSSFQTPESSNVAKRQDASDWKKSRLPISKSSQDFSTQPPKFASKR